MHGCYSSHPCVFPRLFFSRDHFFSTWGQKKRVLDSHAAETYSYSGYTSSETPTVVVTVTLINRSSYSREGNTGIGSNCRNSTHFDRSIECSNERSIFCEIHHHCIESTTERMDHQVMFDISELGLDRQGEWTQQKDGAHGYA